MSADEQTASATGFRPCVLAWGGAGGLTVFLGSIWLTMAVPERFPTAASAALAVTMMVVVLLSIVGLILLFGEVARSRGDDE